MFWKEITKTSMTTEISKNVGTMCSKWVTGGLTVLLPTQSNVESNT